MPRRPLPEHVNVLLVAHFQMLGIATPDVRLVALVDEPSALLAHERASRGRPVRHWATNLHLSTQA